MRTTSETGPAPGRDDHRRRQELPLRRPPERARRRLDLQRFGVDRAADARLAALPCEPWIDWLARGSCDFSLYKWKCWWDEDDHLPSIPSSSTSPFSCAICVNA